MRTLRRHKKVNLYRFEEPVLSSFTGVYNKSMGVKYSYDDFTTRGHGVIEYADPHFYENENQKSKRRTKSKSKYGTRWPGPSPIKKSSQKSNLISKKPVEKQAWDIFKKRYPGQQPKKGQIKEIKRELLANHQKQKNKKLKVDTTVKIKNDKSSSNNKIDELTFILFKRRYPGKQPTKIQHEEIRQEVINARSELGV